MSRIVRVTAIRTRLTRLFVEFAESEQASGLVLLACTFVSLVLANSALGPRYIALWHTHLGFAGGGLALNYSVEHWINDGLMAIFFLLIGLEIKRELYVGELADVRSASLPIMAALGGMLVPAFLHFMLNGGTATQSGSGIPMATDIAFALGVLALLGNKVPAALKVFLAALAIIDDLGAIIVIAIFYVGDFSLMYLLGALGIWAALLWLNRLGVQALGLYVIAGVVIWYFMLQSGVHATLAGVLLAFAVPFRATKPEGVSPSDKLQHFLHRPVAFIILPLFALANTAITLSGTWWTSLLQPNSLGIILGLLLGKPLGIVGASWLAIKAGIAQLPNEVTWRHLVGVGLLGGIGFTMSIFIALLAFSNAEVIQASKTAILLSSFCAGTLGFGYLRQLAAPAKYSVEEVGA